MEAQVFRTGHRKTSGTIISFDKGIWQFISFIRVLYVIIISVVNFSQYALVSEILKEK